MISILNSFARISLEEMSKVKLMNRTDTKYLTTMSGLLKLLELAKDEYMVQSISGEVLMPYYTRYYDTSDCEMYRHHLHGKLTRKKVRVRRYVHSGIEFLEIKNKNNKGRTDKKRISTDALTDAGRKEFLLQRSGYEESSLIPQIENSFTRLTLVNKRMTERLTIDSNLSFHNLVSGIDCNLDKLVIIELKRDGRAESPILSMLLDQRIKPSGFSKYCMGMALTRPTLPANRFKARLRMINKMINK